MKKFLFSLMLLAVSWAGYAQTLGEAFYIYLNDGRFEAFFRQEVDSITFSYEDEQGRTYDEIVMQRVYTKDSVYLIPIASIDSVAFLTPQTIVNEKVFPLTVEHARYISNGSITGFTLSAAAPESMRPRVGHIVVATADCDAFPNGIMATVQSVGNVADGFSYSCKRASIDEVFDQLVAYERLEAVNESADTAGDSIAAVRQLPGKLEKDKKYDLWDFDWESEFGEDEAKLKFGGRDVATLRLAVRKTLFSPLYAKIELNNKFTASMDFHGEVSAEKEWEKQLGKTVTCGKIPVPYTFGLFWLEPKFSVFGYAGISGKASVDFHAHNTRTDSISFVYHKGKWKFPHGSKDDPGIDVAQLNLEGSAEVGLKPVMDFSLNGTGASFGLTGKIGIRETANFVYDANGAADGSLYEAMKDSYVRTTLPWSLQAQASLNLFEDYDVNAGKDDDKAGKDDDKAGKDDDEADKDKMQTEPIGPEDPPQLGHDIYFLPEFSNVYALGNSGDNSAAWCIATASRPCLLPLTLGFQLFDVLNKPVPAVYSSATYSADRAPFSVDVNGLEGGQYTARPVISIMGRDLVASPAVQVIKVATFEAQQADGTVTLHGKVYGTATDKAGFYYGPHIDLENKPTPASYVEATLGANGEFTATLTDLAPGNLYVAAVANVPDNLGQTTESRGEPLLLTIKAPVADEPTAGAVIDLGLSVKWAAWNVGATSPEEIGGYCGWAMNHVSMNYDGSDYEHSDKFANGGTGKLGQLRQARNDIGFDICGNPQYDAALAAGMGRLPTQKEFQELKDNCTVKLITYKERSGLLLTGPNGNSIFLPFAGDSNTGSYWAGTASIYNYRNYLDCLTLGASGTVLGSGPQVSAGSSQSWSAAFMVRGVVD
ncbi:MAG: hypothetical protein IJ559_02790 [Prevotella sp.]|nr:hypothetical protein [Prevotella sp.]